MHAVGPKLDVLRKTRGSLRNTRILIAKQAAATHAFSRNPLGRMKGQIGRNRSLKQTSRLTNLVRQTGCSA